MLRQRERQLLAVARDERAGRAERRRDGLVASSDDAREAELQYEQLFEGQARARAFGLVARAGAVERVERVTARRQSLLLPERGRQRIGDVARQRGEDQLAQLLRRHVLAGGIDRHELG